MKVSGEHFEVSQSWQEKLHDFKDNLVSAALGTGGAATLNGVGLIAVTNFMYKAGISMAGLNPTMVLGGAAALSVAGGAYVLRERMHVHEEAKDRAIIEEAARRDPSLLDKPIGLAFGGSSSGSVDMGVPGEKGFEKAASSTVREYLSRTASEEPYSTKAAQAALKDYVNGLIPAQPKSDATVVAKIENFIGKTLKTGSSDADAKRAKHRSPSA